MPSRQPRQHPLVRLLAAVSLITCLTLTMAAPPEANAQTSTQQVSVKSASFATQIDDGRRYEMIGHGLFTYLVWDAYAGAYYQAAGYPRPAPESDVPRRLVLHYFHAIEADDFASTTLETVRAQVGAVDFPSIRRPLTALVDSYRSVAPGDRYSLTWDGESLILALNGAPLYRSNDKALASAMFAIWLGEDPLDRDFRDALLGR